MATEKKLPEVTELDNICLEIGIAKQLIGEKQIKLRESLLNGIEDILIEMDRPVEVNVSGMPLYENEYWEMEEPEYGVSPTIHSYCDVEEVFFNEDTGVAEVRTDEDDEETYDIRHLGSSDLLEIYKALKGQYDNKWEE